MEKFDSKSESDLINTEAKDKTVELTVEEPSVDLEVENQVVEELPVDLEINNQGVNPTVEEPSVDLEVESQVVEELPVDLEINNQGVNPTVEEPSVDLETEKEVKEFVEKLKQKSVSTSKDGQKLSFLLTGRTGVGKSSTINFLMGKEIAPVGDYEPTTMEVKNYESNINRIEIVVHDTPGLCDDLEEKGNDYKYLELMRSKVNKVDSMWFVSRLDDTRVTRDEKEGIKLISECFTSKIWEQAIIVFTFAGNVSSEKYSHALKTRTELIRNEISKYADVEIANNIPSIAVDNKNKLTPDGKKWLGKLFVQVYTRLSEQDVIPFLMSTIDRIQKPKKEPEVVYRTRTVYAPSPSEKRRDAEPTSSTNEPSIKDKIEFDKEDIKIINDKNDRVIKFMATGAVIGATIGTSVAGPVGTVVGGAVGAGVGVVASGIADVTETLVEESKKFFGKIFGR